MKKYMILIILIIIFIYSLIQGSNIKEPFDYRQCRDQGFSKEFCVQTPISVLSPGTCRCENGEIGQYLPGFGAQCMCID